MTRFQVFKESWDKSLHSKIQIIQSFIQFPAFIFHELCHLFFLGVYMFVFSNYQKLNFSGSYFLKKISDDELGYYSLSITWSSCSSFWTIIVLIAPLIGYISLWVLTIFSFYFSQFPEWSFVLGWYLGFGFGQFMLSKQDLDTVEYTIVKSSSKNKEKFLTLTRKLHVIIKMLKPWQYNENENNK